MITYKIELGVLVVDTRSKEVVTLEKEVDVVEVVEEYYRFDRLTERHL